MSHWLTRRLWRALGRRYTRVVLYAYFQVAHLITLAGVGLFALYADLWLSVSLARSVTVPIRDLRRATDRVAQGDLSARVPVISTDEVGRLAASFNGAVRGLGERERLREAFGAFVDPVLADRVLEEGTTLAGEEVDVTIMFLDIRSFTAFAERADPAQVVGKATASPRKVWPARPRGCARSDRGCAGDRNAGRELRRSRRARRAHAGRVRCASPLPAERARSR